MRAECIRSYGCDSASFAGQSERAALAMVKAAIPSEHDGYQVDGRHAKFGDYLFVHAGIRPGIDLSLQSQADLRWIRLPFLDHADDHGFVVVHGHTITDGIDERPNRIGIDTGAYRTNVLSALGLEGEERWVIDTNVSVPEQMVTAH